MLVLQTSAHAARVSLVRQERRRTHRQVRVGRRVQGAAHDRQPRGDPEDDRHGGQGPSRIARLQRVHGASLWEAELNTLSQLNALCCTSVFWT